MGLGLCSVLTAGGRPESAMALLAFMVGIAPILMIELSPPTGCPYQIPRRYRISKGRQRAAEAAGMTRAEMRAHLVRGHFKLRRTGVYWWSSFVRGRGTGLIRQHYGVEP